MLIKDLCNYFDDPKEIVRIFLATKNKDIALIATDKFKCPIISLKEFISEDVNILTWHDIQILHCFNYIYVYDDRKNYIKLQVFEDRLQMTTTFIYNIEHFNKTWKFLNTVFAEILIGDIILKTSKAYLNLKNNTQIIIDISGFAIYNQDKIMNILLS